MSRVRMFCFLCSLNKLDIWTIKTQHVCSVAHIGACVVIGGVFLCVCVCVFFYFICLIFF
jgi:hypothetical protein